MIGSENDGPNKTQGLCPSFWQVVTTTLQSYWFSQLSPNFSTSGPDGVFLVKCLNIDFHNNTSCIDYLHIDFSVHLQRVHRR